jgi:hypothetical protein
VINLLSLFCFEKVILRSITYHFLNSFQPEHMNDLVNRLVEQAGLTPQQAQKAIETIAGFVKEKFPMLGGAVDQVFAAGNAEE